MDFLKLNEPFLKELNFQSREEKTIIFFNKKDKYILRQAKSEEIDVAHLN